MEGTANHQYEPIENHGIIGNLQTVALVSLKGVIDFLSFPDFDSPTVFASLLDNKKGGHFAITPKLTNAVSKQVYMPDTAVLLTRFFADDGIAEITDFMPLTDVNAHCSIMRRIMTVRGNITFQMACRPRFDYARMEHTARLEQDAVVFQSAGGSCIRVTGDVTLALDGTDAVAEFSLKESEFAWIVLEAVQQGEMPAAVTDDRRIHWQNLYNETIGFWRKWTEQSTYDGRWRELVNRSAITLKLLTSRKYGSPIAAPTFSLPEVVGGARNWDYRYTWTRDSAFTMYAFIRLGYWEEAEAFIRWIKQQCMTEDLRLIYRVNGDTDVTEQLLPHLEGYKGSAPVRIGNAAQEQTQLDIFGELLDTIYLFNEHSGAITFEFFTEIVRQVEIVIARWQQPDHGIWEIRGEKRAFLHTRLMCWVALDRAIKIAENRSFPYPAAEWRAVRDAIYQDIYHGFWNEEKGAWVQYKGADKVDASVLLMPLIRFISPLEKRWRSTMEVVDKDLRLDVLIYRYRETGGDIDGLSGDEGTFSMCSFWYIECLAKCGEVERAVENFGKMIGYANHLGLFSEQIGAKGEHLGNFPQAFTHLALISAAFELDRAMNKPRNGTL